MQYPTRDTSTEVLEADYQLKRPLLNVSAAPAEALWSISACTESFWVVDLLHERGQSPIAALSLHVSFHASFILAYLSLTFFPDIPKVLSVRGKSSLTLLIESAGLPRSARGRYPSR